MENRRRPPLSSQGEVQNAQSTIVMKRNRTSHWLRLVWVSISQSNLAFNEVITAQTRVGLRRCLRGNRCDVLDPFDHRRQSEQQRRARTHEADGAFEMIKTEDDFSWSH